MNRIGMSTVKDVFLLPFAGGSSLLYQKWKIDGYIFHPVEYSGHGFRYKEPLAKDMDDMAEDVIRQIREAGAQMSDYFLFGHSMGALLAWLVMQRMEQKPKALFVSACEPPGCIDVRSYGKYRDDAVLMRYMQEYGRVSGRQMGSKVFRKILFPVLQNDFRVLSGYAYAPASVLDVPVTVLYSREDTRMRYEKMEGWKEFGRDVCFERLEGDHFYLEEERNRERILGIMERVMASRIQEGRNA